MSDQDDSASGLNWTAVSALYAGLLLGLGALLYGGDYRNAVWLGLIGGGGALTAYSRVLAGRGEADRARRWKWGAAAVYGLFFGWAGIVLFRVWMGW